MDYTHFIVFCSQLVYACVVVIDGTVKLMLLALATMAMAAAAAEMVVILRR